MNKAEFYKVYLPTLKKALLEEKDNVLKEPEEYIGNSILANSIMWYIEKEEDDSFLDKVAYYYDTILHEFPNIQGVDVDDYKRDILKGISELEKEYGIKEE